MSVSVSLAISVSLSLSLSLLLLHALVSSYVKLLSRSYLSLCLWLPSLSLFSFSPKLVRHSLAPTFVLLPLLSFRCCLLSLAFVSCICPWMHSLIRDKNRTSDKTETDSRTGSYNYFSKSSLHSLTTSRRRVAAWCVRACLRKSCL